MAASIFSPATNSQSNSQPQPGYFNALLERGRKRTAETGIDHGVINDIPQLQLGLADIRHKVRKLREGSPLENLAASNASASASIRDLYGFAGRPPKQTAGGAEKPAIAKAAPKQPTYGDLDGYVESIQRRNTNRIIDESLARAKQDFDKLVADSLDIDYSVQRQRIYEHFGLAKPSENSSDGNNTGTSIANGSFGRDSGLFSRSSHRRSNGRSSLNANSFGMSKSVIGMPGPKGARVSVFTDVEATMTPAPEDRWQREKQEKLGDKIKQLNVSRINDETFPLCKELAEVEAQPTTDDTTHLVQAYNALRQITGEQIEVQKSSVPGAVRERAYAKQYISENANSREQVSVRRRILNGSRTYLEELCLDDLVSTIDRNPAEARLGGNPATVHKVRAFVRFRAARKELGPEIEQLKQINGEYVWVIIYTLIRCGLFEEVQDYVAENERAIRAADRNFATYLAAYAKSEDKRLPPELQIRITTEYNTKARLEPEDSTDPYRVLCYKVIGRCDLMRKGLDGINSTVHDYLWLQFALAREVNRVEETAGEVYTLDDIQKHVADIGMRHFEHASSQSNAQPEAPQIFFFMLILSGLFEKAVHYLYQHNYVSAVHFAIALDYYGLLRVSDPNAESDELLSHTTRQQAQLAFGHMVGLYTRDFRTSDAELAADYLALINLNSDVGGEMGKRQRELCHEALRELVLETRDFAQLLGDPRADGVRIKGAIEQRLNIIGLESEKEYLKKITKDAARTADENGRVSDATLLFHLAEDYDRALVVLNNAVSEAITTELSEIARIEPLQARQQPGQFQNVPQQQPEGSLSLTAIDDPIELARKMYNLYGSNATTYGKVSRKTWQAGGVLLQLADVKKLVERQEWANALDRLSAVSMIPLAANGNMALIRHAAQSFNELPTTLSRCLSAVLRWTMLCCDGQRYVLQQAEFSTGNAAGARTGDVFTQVARDAMVFAGLIRYKLPGRVWEDLARAGGEGGAN